MGNLLLEGANCCDYVAEERGRLEYFWRAEAAGAFRFDCGSAAGAEGDPSN